MIFNTQGWDEKYLKHILGQPDGRDHLGELSVMGGKY
jgi:hypothetical protein